jgi:hypothetical protein
MSFDKRFSVRDQIEIWIARLLHMGLGEEDRVDRPVQIRVAYRAKIGNCEILARTGARIPEHRVVRPHDARSLVQAQRFDFGLGVGRVAGAFHKAWTGFGRRAIAGKGDGADEKEDGFFARLSKVFFGKKSHLICQGRFTKKTAARDTALENASSVNALVWVVLERMLFRLSPRRKQNRNVLRSLTDAYKAHLDGLPAASIVPVQALELWY